MLSFHLADLIESVVDVYPDADRGSRHVDVPRARARANRAEWLESMLACLKLRAIPINVNYRYVEAELRYLIDNADLMAMVVRDAICRRCPTSCLTCRRCAASLLEDDTPISDSPEAPGAVSYEDAVSAVSADRDFGERRNDDPGGRGSQCLGQRDRVHVLGAADVRGRSAQLPDLFHHGRHDGVVDRSAVRPAGLWNMISTSGANSVMVVGMAWDGRWSRRSRRLRRRHRRVGSVQVVRRVQFGCGADRGNPASLTSSGRRTRRRRCPWAEASSGAQMRRTGA
jgi:hypothetical protein